MKYYLAYGSNLNKHRMSVRCPGAVPVGTAELKDKKLSFNGGYVGYLTVKDDQGSVVPVGVWKVNKDHEKSLDRYEGFPNFYKKVVVKLDITRPDGSVIKANAFYYAMDNKFPSKYPDKTYVDVCIQGCRDFGIGYEYINRALAEIEEPKVTIQI